MRWPDYSPHPKKPSARELLTRLVEFASGRLSDPVWEQVWAHAISCRRNAIHGEHANASVDDLYRSVEAACREAAKPAPDASRCHRRISHPDRRP